MLKWCVEPTLQRVRFYKMIHRMEINMTNITKYDTAYIDWLNTLKNRIKQTQIKATLSANKTIITLYWELGKELYEKQEKQGWGNAVVDNLEKDLLREFPNIKGFSRRNLFYMKGFYTFYQADFEKVQQLVAQIPCKMLCCR